MRALNFWINGNFQSRNWWYNQIATPGSLSSAILRLGVPLSPDQSAKAMRYLNRASVKAGGNRYKDWRTGANLVNQAESVVRTGLIQNDLTLVASVFRLLDEKLGEIKGGGIQPDYTFHQHGPTLLNKGYGSIFASSATDFIKLANGTGFAFSPETIAVINNYLLDGLQWMEYRGTYEYAATGRGLSHPQSGRMTVGGLAEAMSKIPGNRTEELKAAAMRSRGDADAPPLVGNRHFWHSDIMVHRRADYYTSARGHSTRTISTDYVDNKSVNKLAGHVADGANYLFRTGKEYDDIFPVWDWYKVPGTTVAQLESSGKVAKTGKRPFVGGVSDGTYGFAAMDFGQDGLVWRKSWCFFDDSYVCLGSGITFAGDLEVATTLDQRLLDGPVTVSQKGSQQVLAPGEHVLNDVEWLHHDGVAYVFPEPAGVSMNNIAQTGSWKRIHSGLSADPVSEEVFKAWISHGSKPSGASYAYAVLLGVTPKEVAAHPDQAAIRVVTNTWEQHAVRHDALGISGIAFHVIGSVDLHKGLSLAVDKRCLVLVRENDGEIAVSICDPRNLAPAVKCTVTRDGVDSVLKFDLPGGPLAGKSVTQKLP